MFTPTSSRPHPADAYEMQMPPGSASHAEHDAETPATATAHASRPPTPRRHALQIEMRRDAAAGETEVDQLPPPPITQPAADADETHPTAVPIVAGAGAAASTAATDAARAALHRDMAATGCSMEELLGAVHALGGKYVPSQSAGVTLASLNDHTGVLILPFSNRGMRVTERLAVIKDSVPGKPGEAAEEKYFIKGYGNRLIGLKDIATFSAPVQDALEDKVRMETSFRTHLKQCSLESTLAARRTAHESTQPVMPVPPNAMPLPWRAGWSNAENYMADGFGGHPSIAHKPSPYFAGYADYNAIENRLVIFLTDIAHHAQVHPTQERGGKQLPASVNINGSVIAEIQGIAHVETMGPAGAAAGVQLASLRSLLQRRGDQHLHLRVTTEDGAVHDLRYNDRGLKMTLVQPHGRGAEAMAALDNADTCLYTYQGRNTGLHGSVAGYSNPEMLMSTGEALLVGPLLVDRTSWDGRARSAARLLGNLVTLSPTIGATNARLVHALNTTMRAGCVAFSVYWMNRALDSFRDPKTHALLPHAHAFSSSGSGTVDGATLAKAIGVTVLAQEAVSQLFNLAHSTLLKDAWKSKESLSGQVFNEGVLPLAAEFSRLLLNYGIQTGMGLPRGDGYDVATLAGVAGLLTLSGFIKGRAGAAQNHPTAEAVFHTVNFFVGDLLLRSLGAIEGNPKLAENATPVDFAEAYLTRMATRGLDKWVAPLLATALSAAGLLGPNAGAAEDQLTRENRYQGVIAYLRNFVNSCSIAADKLGERGAALVKNGDIEALSAGISGATDLLEALSKNVNRMGMDKHDANPAELLRVQEAAAFHTLDEKAQLAFLEKLTKQFEQMVADVKPPPLPSLPSVPPPAAAPRAVATASTAVSNNRAQLPSEMAPVISSLVNEFAADLDPGRGNYPTKVSPDFLGQQLMYFSKASARLGQKTPRVQALITTFSEAPAAHIARVHDAMAGAAGMPESPADSRNVGPYKYTRLSESIVRAIRAATVKYTRESGFFHYLLRWPQTGQPLVSEVVPGVYLQTTMMNKRGNVEGDADAQISPRDPLLINLGALHARKFPAIVQRAVVTDAAYLRSPVPGKVTITEKERVSLSEILSTTSAEQLAAAFLVALGYGAASDERNLRIVLHQDTAVNIAKYTELMQAETISLPGGIFVVDKVDDNPPVPDGAPQDSPNLGRVVYMRRLDTYKLENKYREYAEWKSGGAAKSPDDGDLAIDPASGHFYRFDKASGAMKFEIASKNYFLGTDVERDETQPARWRYPYTSPASPRGMLDFINAALLLNDPIKPFLNDATRNIHHETDMLAGGFYADDSEVMAESVAALKKTREYAGRAAAEIGALSAEADFPPGRTPAEQGDLLARIVSGALRRPLMLLKVDDAGKLVMNGDKPATLATINTTWDGVNMGGEKTGPTMIGVGPNGYYATGYDRGVLSCVPVRINGSGLTPGNFLHAFMATAYPNPANKRYILRGNAVRSATSAGAQLPGQADSVRSVSQQLLAKLQEFARSDYIPLQSWLSEQHGGPAYPALSGAKTAEPSVPPPPAAPPPTPPGTGKSASSLQANDVAPAVLTWLAQLDPEWATTAPSRQGGAGMIVGRGAGVMLDEASNARDLAPVAGPIGLPSDTHYAFNSGKGARCFIYSVVMGLTGAAQPAVEAVVNEIATNAGVGDGWIATDSDTARRVLAEVERIFNRQVQVVEIQNADHGPIISGRSHDATPADRRPIVIRNTGSHYDAVV